MGGHVGAGASTRQHGQLAEASTYHSRRSHHSGRALADLGADQPRRWILDAAALAGNHAHQRLLGGALAMFEDDPGFRAECLSAAGWALERRLPPGTTPSSEQLRIAVRYFLAELPLFTDTPVIVGRPASVFCYHQAIPFLEKLYRRELAWRPAAGQGFAVLVPTPDSGVGGYYDDSA